MSVILHKLKRNLQIVLTLIWCLSAMQVTGHESGRSSTENAIIDRIFDAVEEPFTNDDYRLADGIKIVADTSLSNDNNAKDSAGNNSTWERMLRYARSRRIDVNLSKVLPMERAMTKGGRFGFGKNSFLTGFGLGFLAFGLKKLLLPIIIGAQIVKSILIAMFLPSILGSVGKLVGKGVTTFAQSSGSSNNFGGAGATAASSDSVNDFDFKDTTAQTNANTNTNYDADTAGSDNAYNTVWTYPSSNGNSLFQYPDTSNYFQQQQTGAAVPAFGQTSPFFANSALVNDYTNVANVKPTAAVTRLASKPKEPSPSKYYSGSFYTKDKTEDFKVFHNIPTSSHLLANYDPFYSPLLSRIDSVFKQLGYTVEPCRERLVCNMYKNPAKYAPFSNLVSAQLSRELNELRKPSSDNPEILRFFKYMKAAKDGQDGQECDIVYSECTTNRAATENAPMVSTYNEINKLVQARNL